MKFFPCSPKPKAPLSWRSCLDFLYFGACAGMPLTQRRRQRRLVTIPTVQTPHGRESINTKIRPDRKRPIGRLPRTSVAWWEWENSTMFTLFSGGDNEWYIPAKYGWGELQTESQSPRQIWRVFTVQVRSVYFTFFLLFNSTSMGEIRRLSFHF